MLLISSHQHAFLMKRFERLSDIKNQGSCSNEEKRAGDKKGEIPMVLSL
jgi:hypothetical protein